MPLSRRSVATLFSDRARTRNAYHECLLPLSCVINFMFWPCFAIFIAARVTLERPGEFRDFLRSIRGIVMWEHVPSREHAACHETAGDRRRRHLSQEGRAVTRRRSESWRLNRLLISSKWFGITAFKKAVRKALRIFAGAASASARFSWRFRSQQRAPPQAALPCRN